MRGAVIVVEGLMGVGKSRLCDDLAGMVGGVVFHEPDDVDGSNPYLDLYYADPKRWALTTQLHLLMKKVKIHEDAEALALSGQVAIIDRSVSGDSCFAWMHAKLGNMTPEEVETYAGLYAQVVKDLTSPDAVVWVSCDVEETMRRIKGRAAGRPGRRAESIISEDYLMSISDEMDKLKAYYHDQGIPTVHLDWDHSDVSSEERRDAILDLSLHLQTILACRGDVG